MSYYRRLKQQQSEIQKRIEVKVESSTYSIWSEEKNRDVFFNSDQAISLKK